MVPVPLNFTGLEFLPESFNPGNDLPFVLSSLEKNLLVCRLP
jgi:hypothetical protein